MFCVFPFQDALVIYAVSFTKIFYGLPKKDFMRLAYEYALANKLPKIQPVWHHAKSATRD